MSESTLPPIHVAVAMPATDTVKTWFMMDLTRMLLHTEQTRPAVRVSPLVAEGSLIPQQRQMLADAAMRIGASHILWIDTDMRFPNNTLNRLLDRNLEIVGANYTERRAPFRPVAFRDWNDMRLRVYTKEDSTGVEQVVGLGSGLLLVKMEVYAYLPRPWFLLGYNTAKGTFLGEDMYFSFKAGQNNFPIHVDHDLSKEVAHIGTIPYTLADSELYARTRPEDVEYTPDETQVHQDVPALFAADGTPLETGKAPEMIQDMGDSNGSV